MAVQILEEATQAVAEQAPQPAVCTPAHRLFSVQDYARMIEAGVLTEDERLELIRGEIRTMSPIGSRHAACVKRLLTLLNRQYGDRAIVSIQDPIRLSTTSELQPDAALLRLRADFYATELPQPADVLLVIEVSDSTLEYDRTEKMTLYAQAGIPQLWVIDLIHGVIEQYTQPLNGRYGHLITRQRGETLPFEQVELAVNDILG